VSGALFWTSINTSWYNGHDCGFRNQQAHGGCFSQNNDTNKIKAEVAWLAVRPSIMATAFSEYSYRHLRMSRLFSRTPATSQFGPARSTGYAIALAKPAKYLLAIAVLILHAMPVLQQSPSGSLSLSGFVVPEAAPGGTIPIHRQELINPDPSVPFSHVASICELSQGRLAAVWYAGSREGGRDVAIYLAFRDPQTSSWSKPRAIVTRTSAEGELRRRIKKVGNPVLFSNKAGGLWVLYVTISIGGWSGSSLNLTRSSDQGQTWSRSERLTLSPFLNVGELVRNPPVQLADGGWMVPIHQELIGHLPELLWLRESSSGVSATKTRMLAAGICYQPALVPLSTNSALAMLRDFSALKGIEITRTTNAGRDWSPPQLSNLPNPDSGVADLRLADGRLLTVFIDSPRKPGDLCLASSRDDGRTWTRLTTLAPGREGSHYPFMLQTEDGQIHVVYTSKSSAIKHLVFNEAWLETLPPLSLE
jgi:predicted neuraminidase